MRMQKFSFAAFLAVLAGALCSEAVAQPVTPSTAAGTVFRDCDKVCPEMVVIPAGNYGRGSNPRESGWTKDEAPRFKVTLARPFAVGRFEVTFDEWDACVSAGGCPAAAADVAVATDGGWGRGRRPAIHVNWFEAQAYVAWLSSTTGHTYRLLTEAEWEYAARAGTATAFAFGEQIGAEAANFQVSGIARTTPVGAYAPNAFGLHDMHGNVWEWVEDCFSQGYARAPRDGTANVAGDCNRRMARGGGWADPATRIRSGMRGRGQAMNRDDDIGFRIARDL